MKQAYLYFWDGFAFSPRIETDWVDLKARILRVIAEKSGHPNEIAARFVAFDLAEDHRPAIWNAPPARTVGQMVMACEGEGNWPTKGGTIVDQAGVFIVNVTTGECRVTGGVGFDGDPEANPRALREMDLFKEDES